MSEDISWNHGEELFDLDLDLESLAGDFDVERLFSPFWSGEGEREFRRFPSTFPAFSGSSDATGLSSLGTLAAGEGDRLGLLRGDRAKGFGEGDLLLARLTGDLLRLRVTGLAVRLETLRRFESLKRLSNFFSFTGFASFLSFEISF